MLSWNYRVMVKDGCYTIHEVYYDDNGESRSFTETAVFPVGDDLADLAAAFELYRSALLRPVLDYNALEEEVTRGQADAVSLDDQPVGDSSQGAQLSPQVTTWAVREPGRPT